MTGLEEFEEFALDAGMGGGFAILECKSKDKAIEMARRFLEVVGGNGESEVRQMAEY